MATFNTTIYSAQIGTAGASANAASTFPFAKNAFGKLRIVQIPYALAGTEAANDFINLTLLKPGDRVLAGYSKIICEDPGTTLTMQIGDASNADRYAGTLVLSSGGSVEFSSVAGDDLYVPTDIAATAAATLIGGSSNETQVRAKVIAAGTLTAAAKLLICLAVVSE
jgi:hypothetical protein